MMTTRRYPATNTTAFSLKELVVFLGAVVLLVMIIVPKGKSPEDVTRQNSRQGAKAVVASIANTRAISVGDDAAIRVAGQNGEEQEFRVSLDEQQRVTLLPYRPAEDAEAVLFDDSEDID